jgi:outer membrane protein assembly factor BamD
MYLCNFMIFKKSYIILLLFALVACNKKYNDSLKSNSVEAQTQKADEYYNKKKYDKAIPIYELLLTVLKGQKSVEEIYYKYAKAQYLNGSYELAAFYLKSFYTTYYNSKYAEETSFLEALSYYKQSPRYSLEQVNTQKAISIFQQFIDKYPKSEYMQEANSKMDELRGKLRKKAYESAYLYYKIGQYNAASVAFKNFMNEFPEYEDVEKIDYLILKSLYRYAEQSYKFKKSERYKEEMKAFESFKSKYPNSKYLAELEKEYILAKSNIENLKKEGL